VGTEVISKFIDWEDRNTAVLFGDGAGAAVLGEVPYPYGIISSYLKADGNGWNLLYLPGGGAAQPASFSSVENKLHYLKMEGKKLYECAIKRMQEAIEELLKSLNLKIEDISLFIAHQANIRIINSVASKLNLPNEKVFINLGKYGNTSAASLPIALYEAKKENRLNSGELVLLAAFGAGLTWGATLIHWH
jgi:3-oxoacyl-[acyl-carrier-protein] synthase-3